MRDYLIVAVLLFRKYLVIIIALILLFIAGYVFYNYKNKEDETFKNIEEEIINVLNYDFNENYPKEPIEVIEKNNEIIKLIYSGKIDDDQLNELLKKQRMLFSKELLEKNPFEKQLNQVVNDINIFTENKSYIKSFELEAPYFDKYTEKICYVDVLEVLKTDDYIKVKYSLVKEDGQYKILGWEYMEGQ